MILAAWNGHTPKSRALAECIDGARRALGWKEEDLAQRMRLSSREELAHMLAGRKPLSLWRLADLPDEWHAEFDRLRVGLRGGVVLEGTTLSLIRDAARVGEKHMAAFTTPVQLQKAKEA